MSGWTKVTEQLPPFDEPVLVYCSDDDPEFVMAAYRDGPNGTYWDYIDRVLSDITGLMDPEPTHWTPKPKPPRN